MFQRAVYRYILMSQQGIHLEFEPQGKDVVQHLKTMVMVDLILLDLKLYGETCYQLIEEIRKLPQYTHIPIVAVSSLDSNEAVPRCRDLGFNGYIAKPINESSLLEQLQLLLLGKEIWTT